MILPNNVNSPNQSQFGGMSPNEMWLRLLSFAYPGRPAYQNSDQAFVDEWDAAIDLFSQTFSGLTLVAVTGSGLPNLSTTGFTVPSAFKADCAVPDMDCAAESAVLSHFADPQVGGSNAKATQSSGMKGFGRTLVYNLGVHGVEWLAQRTAPLASPSAQVLGGEQFDTSAALHPVEEGCTSEFPPHPRGQSAGLTDASAVPVSKIPPECLAPGISGSSLAAYGQFGDVPARDLISPEQAIYNVLGVFFSGTPAASSFGATLGTASYNYLQVYNQDILYATSHANAPAQIVTAEGTSVSTTAQDLLDLASQKLLQMSEPNP